MAGREEAQYLPVKPKKTPKPKREGVVFVACHGAKAVMIRRPEKGLLGGMMGFPTAGWASAKEAADKTAIRGSEDAPFAADWRPLNQGVKHIFTHFELGLTIYHANLDSADIPIDHQLVSPEEAGLASVFAKVWQIVLARNSA